MTLCAFVPVFNAGRDPSELAEFTFKSGARLSLNAPSVDGPSFHYDDRPSWMSEDEHRSMELALGWLSITKGFDYTAPRDAYEQMGGLCRRLEYLQICISLAGGGENDYWRGAGLHCCGAYLKTEPPMHAIPHRHSFIHPSAFDGKRLAGWTVDRLQVADELDDALATYPGARIPRLALSFQLRRTMTAWDARQWPARLQLATTALETFYIAPNEHRHLWDSNVKQRLRQVCSGSLELDDTYFEQVRQLRNDVVHRGAPGPEAFANSRGARIIAQTEDALRATLRWGVLNQALIAEAFDGDEWPSSAAS